MPLKPNILLQIQTHPAGPSCCECRLMRRQPRLRHNSLIQTLSTLTQGNHRRSLRKSRLPRLFRRQSIQHLRLRPRNQQFTTQSPPPQHKHPNHNRLLSLSRPTRRRMPPPIIPTRYISKLRSRPEHRLHYQRLFLIQQTCSNRRGTNHRLRCRLKC